MLVYSLIPQADYNSKGLKNWFYFQVDNVKPNQKYKFIVCLDAGVETET